MWAAEPTGRVSGLSLPILDEAGRATRRLTGDVSGSRDGLKLTGAVVDFFAPENLTAPPVARLFVDEATYLRAESAVAGEGELRFRSVDGNIDGKGYRYDLTGDRFTLRAGFRIELPDATIEGREADVTLRRNKSEVIIGEFEARGNIVVTPRDPAKFEVERARSEKAWYSARDGILRIAPPVVGLRKGVETSLGAAAIEMKLDGKR